MKRFLFLITIVFFTACQHEDEDKVEVPALSLSSDNDSISYSLGVNLASQLKEQGLTEINPEVFQQALMHVFTNDSLHIQKEKSKVILNTYYKKLRQKRLETYLFEGKEFLKKNRKRKGVKKMPSGLQYEVLTQGNGQKPRKTQNVKCHYTGFLLDSTIIESTIKSGVPSIFPVNSVMPGMSEALQNMQEGSKWRIYIPTELAYGERPHPGGVIKPNMALIYEIELLSIEP